MSQLAITFAMVLNAMQVLRTSPPTVRLNAVCYKFNGLGVRPTPVATIQQADGIRIVIPDETAVESTLARIALACAKFGKVISPAFTTDGAGKRVYDLSAPHYSVAPAQGSGLWLDVRLGVQTVQI